MKTAVSNRSDPPQSCSRDQQSSGALYSLHKADRYLELQLIRLQKNHYNCFAILHLLAIHS